MNPAEVSVALKNGVWSLRWWMDWTCNSDGTRSGALESEARRNETRDRTLSVLAEDREENDRPLSEAEVQRMKALPHRHAP
jgi:hypothetical protein